MAIVDFVDLLPNADSTLDIGSTSLRYAEGWFDCVTAGVSVSTNQLNTDEVRDESGTTSLSVYSTGAWHAGDSYDGNGYNTTGWSIITSTTCLCSPITYGSTCVDGAITCGTTCMASPLYTNGGVDVIVSGGDLCVCDGIGGGFCDICGYDFCAANSVSAGFVYATVSCFDCIQHAGQNCICIKSKMMDCDGSELKASLLTSPWSDQTGYYCLAGNCRACAIGFDGGDISATCWTGTCWYNSGTMFVQGGALCVGDGAGSWNDICGGAIYSNGSQLGSGPWSDQTGYYCLPTGCAACSDAGFSGGYFSGNCLEVGTGYVAADYLCSGSQGCICVCSCLLDCNGSEILGGGSASPWCEDGSGCLYQCTAACSLYSLCTFTACCDSNFCCTANFHQMWACFCFDQPGYHTACIISDCCANSMLVCSCLYGNAIDTCAVCGTGVFSQSCCCYGVYGCSYYCYGGYFESTSGAALCAAGCLDGYCFYTQGIQGYDGSWTNGGGQTVCSCNGIIVSVM